MSYHFFDCKINMLKQNFLSLLLFPGSNGKKPGRIHFLSLALMITHLTGILREKSPASATVDLHGLTFELQIPFSTFTTLGDPPTTTALFTHLQFREDGLTLFGFATKLEKQIFLKLIGVSGIGPKLGIAILSALPPVELITAVRAGNAKLLSSTPGIGKKTADRIILELQEPFLKLALLPAQELVQPNDPSPPNQHQLSSDLISALTNLGWQTAAVEKVITQTLTESPEASFEKLFKDALKKLYK
ncbi:MAG: Holliday junction branch migration protein RuvA [Blastocatellia bacterium]|nr:Holliday junction branch migration protein RuvA [Blastocatellia bacterium]